MHSSENTCASTCLGRTFELKGTERKDAKLSENRSGERIICTQVYTGIRGRCIYVYIIEKKCRIVRSVIIQKPTAGR